MTVRKRELNPHQRRFNAAEDEENKGGHDIALRDHFVISVSKPAAQSTWPRPGALELFLLALHLGRQLLLVHLHGHRFPRALRVFFFCFLCLFVAHFKLCKYSTNACKSASDKLCCGIRFPGLNICESLIHCAIWSLVFESVAAAIMLRLPTCVRFGPMFEPAGVPLIAWHITQVAEKNTCCPRFCESLAGGKACCV